MQRFGTIITAIVLVVVAFFIGRLTVKPLDGNPVGYHLHGLAKIDQSSVNLSSCSSANPCSLNLDIDFNPTAAPSTTPTPCPASSCFSFHNLPSDGLKSKMTVTIDEATSSGYSNSVYADGAVSGS
jgi:hypothetical protein